MSFETINPYAVNKFDMLNTFLNSNDTQDKYCQRWLQHYSKIFINPDSQEIVAWEIRLWKAIKEIYAASIFYKEAEYVFKSRCMASYYFLLYYSLFHGMMSAICFDVNIKLENIIDITHSKVGNLFNSTFCNGKNKIISPDIFNSFLTFKYLREYYSYKPPLNLTFYKSEYLEMLDSYLAQCFQLANLHSLLLEKSFRKNGDFLYLEKASDRAYFYKMFCMAIAQKNIESNELILDPADSNVLNEILENGSSDFQCIGLQLDHTFDEFRLYNGARSFFTDEAGIKNEEIYSFIFNKII